LAKIVLFFCISASGLQIFQECHTSHCFLAYKWCNFGVDRSKIKGTFLGEQSTFSSVLRLLNQRFCRNITHDLLRTWSLNDVRKMALYVAHNLNFFCISASVLGGFHKRHASHPACPGCKFYMFRTDRSTIKNTLLGERNSFSTVSRILLVTSTRILDHTQRRTTVGRTPLAEWSARCRDLYLSTHNTHKTCIHAPRWDSNPQSQQASGRRPTP